MCSQTLRRYRTAKKIQAAAVELATRNGITNVTTEEIARQAGISTRTFFNYFPYKEAAIMGPPPDYPFDAAEDFANGTGRIIDDLDTLIGAHLRRFLKERDMLAQMFALAETDPKLLALSNNAILSRRDQMRALLHRRLPDRDPALIEILAAAIVAATNAATRTWIAGETHDFIAGARRNLAMIGAAADLMLGTPDPDNRNPAGC